MEPVLAEGDDCALSATAVCWLADEPQPGLVLVELTDVRGRPYQLVAKSAYFDDGTELTPTATYPRPTLVPCTIDHVHHDTATVTTRWIGDRHGEPFVFDVPLAALTSR
ncbi:hypothetical protein [Saccharothrix variisporea]|uniref:hypothetical protein n=1 Tax=Saccharothrix variisporea TaxID=543527 RepID=UPI0011C49F4E|nr:hypothetical protein [Saccharothrix variisporea]